MNVAILGYGTVGSGVFEVLNMNRASIAKKAGEELKVKYVLDLREFPGDPVEPVLVHDFNVIVNDPEVDIVLEVMGGEHPAYEFSKAALESGKSVCTSNKELVSKHGAELIAIAEDKKVNYFFEASVGGGIPIMRPLRNCLTADEILEIKSIINGTTNFILTQMSENGTSFESALADAQARGYAERNPAADIEGLDACRKTAILAALVSGKQVNVEDIYTEGITKITDVDMSYARALGYNIKLLSVVKREGDGIAAYVAPHFVSPDCQLYNVSGVFNALEVTGNAVNKLMFFGSGAGKMPTASAVVSDAVEAALHRHVHVPFEWSQEVLQLEKFEDQSHAFFVRVQKDMKALAKKMFNITEFIENLYDDEYAFLCEPLTEKEFAENIAKIEVKGWMRVDR